LVAPYASLQPEDEFLTVMHPDNIELVTAIQNDEKINNRSHSFDQGTFVLEE